MDYAACTRPSCRHTPPSRSATSRGRCMLVMGHSPFTASLDLTASVLAARDPCLHSEPAVVVGDRGNRGRSQHVQEAADRSPPGGRTPESRSPWSSAHRTSSIRRTGGRNCRWAQRSPRRRAATCAVFSGHNALASFGEPAASTTRFVFVGAELPRAEQLFRHCAIAGRLDDLVGMDNEEQGQPIAVCTGLVGGMHTVMQRLAHLG